MNFIKRNLLNLIFIITGIVFIAGIHIPTGAGNKIGGVATGIVFLVMGLAFMYFYEKYNV